MHYACLVVGHDPEAQLAPLAQDLEMPRRKVFLDADEVGQMANHLSIPASDLDGLAASMPEWQEAEGGVEDGRLFYWSTENPNGKYDWYQVGGRFADSLVLARPRPPSWWRKLLGAGPQERASQARKIDIQPGPLLADPPAAVLIDGAWHEGPITMDAASLEHWRVEFAQIFASIPDDALLTIADLHS
jgi:hypothetical protein